MESVDTTLQDPLVGRMLDGRYLVESRVARGGMATVYLALDTRLDRTVALKVMHPELAEDPEFVSRFIREAKSAARLSHPNIVAVYDQGTDGGHVFLAMEYIQGQTLRDVMRRRVRLTPGEAFTVLDPVLAALGAAHAAGLIHRDVKPENVLLADDGRVKVADFGLVRAVSSTTTSSTAGDLLGTVNYLSPEQVQRGIADPRSDVYAAGILLYEMLTGEKPHDGENPIHVVYRHVHEDVPPPSARVPAVPPSVDGLVAAATARDPDLRPANASQFLANLHTVRRGLSEAQLDGVGDGVATHPLTQPVVRPVTEPAVQPGQNHHDTIAVPRLPPAAGNGRAVRADQAVRGRQGRGWVALIIILALAVLVSISAWWFGSGRYTVTPSVLNLTQAKAGAKISAAGLQPQWRRQFSETVGRGLVVATHPRPNDRIVRGGTLTVYLSAGPERIAIPPLAGRQGDEAERTLTESGLAVTTEGEYSDSIEKGVVIAVKPPPGTKVKRGTAVTLVVSKGEAPVEVPDVVGRSVEGALRRLERAGLTGSIAGEVFSDTVRRGAVAKQDPAGKAGAEVGAQVRLVVSKGPQLFEVPRVTGMSVGKAQRTLEKAGFRHRVVSIPGGPDKVLAQFPGAGSLRPKNTRVTLSAF